ncbi:mitochondrial PGP phosphatase-domain-containing protein, partial [Suillus spraguei]
VDAPGILVPFHLLKNPRLVIPHVTTDIRQIDLLALRNAGYREAVFDRDNCLISHQIFGVLNTQQAIPYKDILVPQLKEAWRKFREAFGEGNVIILNRHRQNRCHITSVTLLQHDTLKPGYSCIASIHLHSYFSFLCVPIPDDELAIVGDHIFTDVIMANRMRSDLASSSNDVPACARIDSPLAIWTDGVWQKESMTMRRAEKRLSEMSSVSTHIYICEGTPFPGISQDWKRAY